MPVPWHRIPLVPVPAVLGRRLQRLLPTDGRLTQPTRIHPQQIRLAARLQATRPASIPQHGPVLHGPVPVNAGPVQVESGPVQVVVVGGLVPEEVRVGPGPASGVQSRGPVIVRRIVAAGPVP